MSASLLRLKALAERSVQEAAGRVSFEAVKGTERSWWCQEEGADFWLPGACGPRGHLVHRPVLKRVLGGGEVTATFLICSWGN